MQNALTRPSDMTQLTVRNVDPAIAAALKARAKRTGRSAEAEHRRILEEALRPEAGGDFFALARARRIKLSPDSPDTTELLREDRDRGNAAR
jgi:plasmid stability protein